MNYSRKWTHGKWAPPVSDPSALDHTFRDLLKRTIVLGGRLPNWADYRSGKIYSDAKRFVPRKVPLD
jgi:hypothetical protein